MPESTAGVDGEHVAARPDVVGGDVRRPPGARSLGTDAARARATRRRRVVALEAGRIDRRPAARLRRFRVGGRPEHAMWMAGRLSIEHFIRGDPAVGAGWLMKAQRLAADVPEGVGHGFLLIVEATVARFSGDLPRALELAGEAAEIGRRLDDPDVSAMATHTAGRRARRGRRRRAWGGAPRRGDDQRRGRAAEPVLHRHRLLQRDRHLPRDRGRPQGGPMERGRARVVRDAPARVPVPRDVPGEPCGGREAPRGVAGGRGGGDASLGGADGVRSDGRGAGVLRDGRDPPADRQPGRRGGVLRPSAGDRLRSAAGAVAAARHERQHGRCAGGAPTRRRPPSRRAGSAARGSSARS